MSGRNHRNTSEGAGLLRHLPHAAATPHLIAVRSISSLRTSQGYSVTEAEKAEPLKRYSEGRMSAAELRSAFRVITFADVLIALAQRDLPERPKR